MRSYHPSKSLCSELKGWIAEEMAGLGRKLEAHVDKQIEGLEKRLEAHVDKQIEGLGRKLEAHAEAQHQQMDDLLTYLSKLWNPEGDFFC